MTAATRSLRFLCHRQRSVRSPHRPDPDFSRTPGRAHGPCPTKCCVTGPGRTGSSAPTIAFVGAGFYPAHGRGNRRSAASGGRSEAISRKCPDWRPRQWPGIGWHNGGQESPSPTHPLYPPVGAGVPDGPFYRPLAPPCHCEGARRPWQSIPRPQKSPKRRYPHGKAHHRPSLRF